MDEAEAACKRAGNLRGGRQPKIKIQQCKEEPLHEEADASNEWWEHIEQAEREEGSVCERCVVCSSLCNLAIPLFTLILFLISHCGIFYTLVILFLCPLLPTVIVLHQWPAVH